MEKEIRDSELKLEWVSHNTHLRVYAPDGELLYSSVTGTVSPRLSERQATWIKAHWLAKRMNYEF